VAVDAATPQSEAQGTPDNRPLTYISEYAQIIDTNTWYLVFMTPLFDTNVVFVYFF